MALALAAIWACGGGDEPGDEPVISKDNIDVQTSVNLLGDGHTLEIAITANCSWTIEWDADWLSVNPTSGHGTQQISITAGKNTTGDQRVDVLRVQGGSSPTRMVTVTQAKASDTEPTQPTNPTDPTKPENPDTEKEPTAGDNLPPSS